jgi:short-subunit dehydrogenase
MTSAVPNATPRVVLITGATSGIGLAAALQSAGRGDHLLLLARSRSPLEAAADQCRAAGAASVRVLSVDIVDAPALDSAISAAVAELGPLDVVIHSAGIAAFGEFTTVPAEVFDRVIAVNVSGAANVARAVLPGMRDRNAGTLVLLGSLEGHITPPFMSAYAASKWAVRSLARGLQIENRDRTGVHVCCLAPAGVDTPIYAQAANYLQREQRPPPPVASPEKVAAVALGLADVPRRNIHVGVANRVIEFGYLAMPWVYDRLVTPLFKVVVSRPRSSAAASPGNVFEPPPDEVHTQHG